MAQVQPQLAQRQQPIVDDAELLVRQRGVDAAAAGVAADDNVLDFEVDDGVFDDGAGVQVARVQDVGDVAMHEDVAWFEAQDGGFGNAGVGAADPEDLGVLAAGEGGEEGGVFVAGFVGPVFVFAQDELEVVWFWRRGC